MLPCDILSVFSAVATDRVGKWNISGNCLLPCAGLLFFSAAVAAEYIHVISLLPLTTHIYVIHLLPGGFHVTFNCLSCCDCC